MPPAPASSFMPRPLRSTVSNPVAPRKLSDLTSSMVRMRDAAWTEFHGRYYDRLLGYAITLHRGDVAAAEDTVQDAMLRVVRHIRKFSDEEVLWSWLTLLIRCAAADQGRKQARQNRLHNALLADLNTRRSKRSMPEILVLLTEALDCLPAPDRRLLTEKYMHRQPTAQLAAEYDQTPKAVENRLRRLRKKLRKHIHELIRQTR